MTARHRVPPHDPGAERALLGAMLLSPSAIAEATRIVKAQDYHDPGHRLIHEAIIRLWAVGDPVDAVTVAGVLQEDGTLDSAGGSAALVSLMASCPATSAARRYAESVANAACYRRLIGLCAEVEQMAYDREREPADLVDLIGSRLGEIEVAEVGRPPTNLTTIDEFLDRPGERRPPWVVPGLIRVGWRVMIVAAEGAGKTVLCRQIGMAAAQGIHPLHFEAIEPQRVLIVDLENPDDSILDVCEPIRVQAVAKVRGDYDPDRAWLWHEPGGIDLRSRRGRSDLEAVVAHVQPSLVCLGPLYKAYNVTARESDELAASEVMTVFDDLRTRYSFALLLEHHAPKGTGRTRELMPYGSSLWLRWPEIGLQLRPKTPDGAVMEVGRWRGDRLKNSWPVEIERSLGWPWRGVWPMGTFTSGVPTTAQRDPIGGEPRRAEEVLRDLPETPWGGESPPGVDPETGEVLDQESLFGEEIPF